jgi:hypothetical protein
MDLILLSRTGQAERITKKDKLGTPLRVISVTCTVSKSEG